MLVLLSCVLRLYQMVQTKLKLRETANLFNIMCISFVACHQLTVRVRKEVGYVFT